MKVDATLPRETNATKARSILARSLVLLARARMAERANPNVATVAKRMERTLACWAQSRKVLFIRIATDTRLSGAAKGRKVRKAARTYREAIKTWRAFYYGAGNMGD